MSFAKVKERSTQQEELNKLMKKVLTVIKDANPDIQYSIGVNLLTAIVGYGFNLNHDEFKQFEPAFNDSIKYVVEHFYHATQNRRSTD